MTQDDSQSSKDPEDTKGPDATQDVDAAEPTDTRPRKERVLHTRIPAVLEAELKAAAAALRVPVSNLVRTILEDAVAAADRATGQVEEGLKQAAKSVHRERDRLRRKMPEIDPLADVVGYQALLVAKDSRCVACGEVISAGTSAFLAVTGGIGRRLLVCGRCVPSAEGSKS